MGRIWTARTRVKSFIDGRCPESRHRRHQYRCGSSKEGAAALKSAWLAEQLVLLCVDALTTVRVRVRLRITSSYDASSSSATSDQPTKRPTDVRRRCRCGCAFLDDDDAMHRSKRGAPAAVLPSNFVLRRRGLGPGPPPLSPGLGLHEPTAARIESTL